MLLPKPALLLLTALALSLAACGGSRTQVRCSSCADGLVCDTATGACVAPVAPDGGCTQTSCTGATPRCAADGRCVACLSNGDCPQGSCDTRAGRCVAAAAEGCGALASFIEVAPGALRLRGSTATAAHDTQLGCAIAGSSGRDVVFGLRLSARHRLTATVRAVDGSSGFQPVVAVRTECAASRAELACGFAQPGAGQASLVTELAAGAVFLWVDSETDTGGEFELELTFDDAPNVDSCAAPSPLRGNDTIDVSGETLGLADDVAASCGGQGAPDAIYRLSLDRPRRAKLEAVGLSGFKPTLSVRRVCAEAGTEIACAAGLTGTGVIELPSLDTGDYAVIVDGPASAAMGGRFRLRVTLSEPVPPPSNDLCATALELVPPMGATSVTVQGDTTQAKNDAVGCDGTGADLVYTLQLPSPQRVRAQVTPLAGSRLQPVLYLRRENQCESQVAREQLFCVAAGQGGFPALLEVPRLEAGRWFLFVDGKARTAGAFDLTLELLPPPTPPANDSCAMPTALPLANGPVFLPAETTTGAAPDAVTCVDTPGTPDVAYTFALPSRQSLSIDARALPGSRLVPVVTLKPQGTCTQTAPIPFLGTCAFSDLQVPDRAVAVVPALGPGSYTLWVSGDLASQGDFSLRVSPGPPLSPPPNDACGSSSLGLALNVGGSAAGDTRAAGNSTEGRCGFPLGANGELGGDVAYLFQVTAATPSLSITVVPDANGGALMRPVIYVRGGAAANNVCTTAGTNLGCQAAPDFGAPVTLSLSNVQPGTYTLWVDGAGLSAGSFTLSIR